MGTPAGAFGNVYIDANEPLTNNGIVATIALQNSTDQGGPTNPDSTPPGAPFVNGRAPGADANPEFSGEITATRCAITGVRRLRPSRREHHQRVRRQPAQLRRVLHQRSRRPHRPDAVGLPEDR